MGAIIAGESFPDPKDGPFGMGSAPGSPAIPYEDIKVLTEAYSNGARKVISLLEKSDAGVLQNKVTLARWQDRMPVAGLALPYLMLVHENQHMGQISAWRRALALPSV
jgi:hypothetical protein